MELPSPCPTSYACMIARWPGTTSELLSQVSRPIRIGCAFAPNPHTPVGTPDAGGFETHTGTLAFGREPLNTHLKNL